MIQPVNKIKRGTPFIDTVKGINIWVWHDKQDGEVLVYDSPQFNGESYLAKISDLMPIHKQRSSSIKSKPKVLSKDEKENKNERNIFFESLQIPEHCQECGQKLIAFNSFARRSVSAHILPKAYFKNVEHNPLNILFLGAGFLGGCDCHGQYDTNVDNRIKMKVYYLAVKQFKEFRHLLNSDELDNALDYLNLKK